MKALYEGTSRKKAILIIIGDMKVVNKRKIERKRSRRADKSLKWWIEDAAPVSEKYDKGKGKGPWSNYNSYGPKIIK